MMYIMWKEYISGSLNSKAFKKKKTGKKYKIQLCVCAAGLFLKAILEPNSTYISTYFYLYL